MQWNKDTIRAARRKAGLTQKLFAEKLGTSQQMVSEWEKGTHSPKNAYIKLLTATFGDPPVLG